MQQLIKIKCPCEHGGTQYDGVAVADGVNIDVGDGCNPLLGQVVSFSKDNGEGGTTPVNGPVLFVAAVQSVSIGCDVPPEFLVLTTGDSD